MASASELWKNTLALLETNVDSTSYNTWIAGLSLIRYDKAAGTVSLDAGSEFKKSFLELKYADIITAHTQDAFGAPVSVRFLLPSDPVPAQAEETLPDENIFNPRYTFDNFVPGPNNRFASGAARAVAEAPGKTYSPLFIYGDSGLGKTHLMNAIGIYILEHFPKMKVLYVSSETFTEEFVNASMQRKMNDFKIKYRNIDVLLIDDIQFISEKEKTIEEVFNTYQALYKGSKQMVFSSDKPPKDLLSLDERLRSRLASGLLVDIQPPSYEIKVAILKKKALLDNVPEDEGLSEVISFISEIVKSNVRELESAFNRVVAYAKFTGSSFTKSLAKQVLKDVVQMSNTGGPAVKDIKKVTAGYFGVTISDIDSAERSRAFATPRQIAMYLSRTLTKLSFPKIAAAFGKDYSTVHHAYEKINKERQINEQLAAILEELTEKIENDY
jgi:chromosomal replication initiator protein